MPSLNRNISDPGQQTIVCQQNSPGSFQEVFIYSQGNDLHGGKQSINDSYTDYMLNTDY